MKRHIIEINTDLCTGCGLCVSGCAEGAIAIRNGKAVIISDSYCDGLGACLAACPENALRIIEREAVPFDEAAAMDHVRNQPPHTAQASSLAHQGCAGSKPAGLNPFQAASKSPWPVKLRLVSPSSPFLQASRLLIAADCAPAAARDFHSRFHPDSILLLLCPKFENRQENLEKLHSIFSSCSVQCCTVIRMEVPCCQGLVSVCKAAYAQAHATFPLEELCMRIDGSI